MRFSNKAYKYLDKLKRDSNFTVTEKNDIIEYLIKQGIPAFEKIIDFQLEYSGLELTIFNKPSSTFMASMFSGSDIFNNAEIDLITVSGQLYFYCGEHKTAQIYFVLSQKGELCTYDSNNKTINIVFSSFDKFIETYASMDILGREEKYEHPPYYDLIDQAGLEKLNEKFVLHTTANDVYNIWRSNKYFMIYQGRWLDRPSSFIHLYANSKINCEIFVEQLKKYKIIA